MVNYDYQYVRGTSQRVYTVRNPTGKVYNCQIPSVDGLFVCDCPDYIKKSKYPATNVTKNCKHIVGLLIKMGVPKQNMLLFNTVLNDKLKHSLGQYALPAEGSTSGSKAAGSGGTVGSEGSPRPGPSVGSRRPGPIVNKQTASQVQHEYVSFREAKLAIDKVRCKYLCNIYPKGRGRASLCAAKHKIALTKLQPCVQVDLMRIFKQDGQAFGNQKAKFFTKFE